MLPMSYILKNLTRDPMRTLQVVGGAFAVVLPLMCALAFDRSMTDLMAATGDPANVVVLARDATESLQRSSVPGETQGEVASQKGVVAVSTEVHFMSPVQSGTHAARGYIRGVLSEALIVHPAVKVVQGTFPKAGEVMLGALVERTMGFPIGDTLEIGGETYRVSGRFIAPGTRYESEIWADKNDVLTLTKRDRPSCVVARIDSPVGLKKLENLAFRRADLELSAVPEPVYYAALAKFFRPIATITWLCAILVAAGAVFGGLNTLYAAFGARTRELAALRAIGYRRRSLFAGLLAEAVQLSLLGTLPACYLAVFALDGTTIPLSLGTLTLHFDLPLVGVGIATGTALGLLGAAIPAANCLRIDLPQALRST